MGRAKGLMLLAEAPITPMHSVNKAQIDSAVCQRGHRPYQSALAIGPYHVRHGGILHEGLKIKARFLPCIYVDHQVSYRSHPMPIRR